MPLPAARAGDLERLRLPDVRRLEQMPSLPAWVASRAGSLTTETQPDPSTGKWRPTPTLPSNLILNANEREELVRHVDELAELCRQTPLAGDRWQEQTWAAVTKMMLVMPSATQNEISAEARGEAYLMALDDVPAWAVQAAIRRWYRGDCGTSEENKPYDYHWCPAPAELRRISKTESYRVEYRARQLRRILSAEARQEYSDEHCRVMRERIAELFRGSTSSPVGKTAAAR